MGLLPAIPESVLSAAKGGYSVINAGQTAKSAIDTARAAIKESGGIANALEDFTQGLLHVDYLKTWDHAARLHNSNNHEYAPKYGFMFHVSFEINPIVASLIPQLTADSANLKYGMLVKSFSLPKADIETKRLNAYNRPDNIQTKLKYQPVSIKFHDDSKNAVTNLWKEYVDYYYRDATYKDRKYELPTRYTQVMPTQSWGYQPKLKMQSKFLGEKNWYDLSQPPVFNSIKLYSLSNRRFTEYTLINPIISKFNFGEHASDAQGFLDSEMTVEFEAVIIKTGNVSPSTVAGFAQIDYDVNPSPLASIAGGVSGVSNLLTDVGDDNGILGTVKLVKGVLSGGSVNLPDIASKLPKPPSGLSFPGAK